MLRGKTWITPIRLMWPDETHRVTKSYAAVVLIAQPIEVASRVLGEMDIFITEKKFLYLD